MAVIGIIGSGPSGVAAAYHLVQKGMAVELIDVGFRPEPWSAQLGARITESLKAGSPPRAADMMLLRNGKDQRPPSLWQSLTTLLKSDIGAEKVLKRIVGSTFVFDGVSRAIPVTGASVPLSLAEGGLSNLWGAACYGLNSTDINEWPFSFSAINPFYKQCAHLLNLWQVKDALEQAYPFYPTEENNSDTSRNPGSPLERVLTYWQGNRADLEALGIHGGQSRLAVTPPAVRQDAPGCCLNCGLCFYGCPAGAIFSTTKLLRQLTDSAHFHYHSGFLASHAREENGRICLHGTNIDGNKKLTKSYSHLLLGAGPISSFQIAARSIPVKQPTAPVIDNDLYIVPFLLKKFNVPKQKGFRSRFSLSEAALYIEPGRVARKGVHIQFYTFNEFFLGSLATAMEQLPSGWANIIRSSFNHLVIGFIYFHSDESRQGTISLSQDNAGQGVRIDATEKAPSKGLLKTTLNYLARHQRQTGLRPLAMLAKETPFGFSGHLGGTLAMSDSPHELTCSAEGKLHGFQNVYCIDAASFPTMSAQNPTFTTMANAMRIADTVTSTRNDMNAPNGGTE